MRSPNSRAGSEKELRGKGLVLFPLIKFNPLTFLLLKSVSAAYPCTSCLSLICLALYSSTITVACMGFSH